MLSRGWVGAGQEIGPGDFMGRVRCDIFGIKKSVGGGGSLGGGGGKKRPKSSQGMFHTKKEVCQVSRT